MPVQLELAHNADADGGVVVAGMGHAGGEGEWRAGV